MTDQDLLALAALLHDIGKFRMRHIQPNKRHQEHSYEFVTEEFADFFSSCDETFRNAIRHHHPERYPKCRPDQLQHLIEKQVILADRLSASEREDEEREREYFGQSALVSIFSRLEGATLEYRYRLTALNLDNRDVLIPSESAEVNQDAYTALWKDFTSELRKATAGCVYTPAFYQTLVALLRKYTSRMPSSTPWGQSETRTVPDISLYDHLRTTAAIAVCIGRERSEEQVDALLGKDKGCADEKICSLIKGDLSGIQSFLYQIVSDGASNQLRGRSFYLQLLTEAIAHDVLRQLHLPITNLLLASGGHFYILAPYRETQEKLQTIRQRITQNLWAFHRTDLSCLLASTSLMASDFAPDKFSDKWHGVGEKVRHRKLVKYAEMTSEDMFETFFQPQENTPNDYRFETLGQKLRHAESLVAFEVEASPVGENPDWQAAIKAFGLDVHLRKEDDPPLEKPPGAQRAIVYSLKDTDFLADAVIEKFKWDGVDVRYDFRMLPQVIAHNADDTIADYNALANASEGVLWLGALRMDVDDLGSVFKEKLGRATISRVVSLSASLRLFFEGYIPKLCRDYNAQHTRDRLELIYAGGDDLFLVGAWNALPEIAEHIRCEFRHFVTGDHITLSGGIVIEHKKYPLYQFAAQSGDAEGNAKRIGGKNAITFLREPMKWETFETVRDWHQKFLDAVGADTAPLPIGFLTRLTQIQTDKKRWAWRSLYYLHRLEERYRPQRAFLEALREALQPTKAFRIRDFIPIITRWTALRIRK